MTAGAIGLPAIITFLLARRIRAGSMGNRLARKIREKGLAREVPKGEAYDSDLLNYLQYGSRARGMPTSAKSKQLKEVFFSPISETQFTKSRVRGGNIGFGKEIPGIESKRMESKIFGKAVPDLYPKTILGDELPRRIFKIKDPMRRATELQKHLDKKLGKKWIMKGTDESQTAGTLITEKDDLREILAGALALNPKSRLKVQRTIMDKFLGRPENITYKRLLKLPEDEQVILRQRIPGLHAREMMKEMMKRKGRRGLMIQKRFPIGKLGPVDEAAIMATTGQPANLELRVHAIGNKVLPGSTAHRFGGLSELSVLAGQRPGYFRTAERAVEKALGKAKGIKPKYVKNRAFSFDVAITPKGKARIIETNPEGFSGLVHQSPQLGGLFDPISAVRSHRMVSDLQGQTTIPLAALRSSLAGGLGYGGLATLRELTE